VKQGGTYRHRCQFSFFCDGKSEIPKDAVAWETALDIAEMAAAGAQIIVLQGCVHYYSILFDAPYWTEDLIEVATIGHHRFYLAF
jgi:spore germination cell wall hydrolase CwlJ-like protein